MQLHLPGRISAAVLGRAGERRATWFYRLRGFRVVGRNVASKEGEIDLIVRRGRLMVFVEVKTRGEGWRGEGFEAVDRAKQLQVARLAERFLDQQRFSGCTVRFDVVSLRWNGWWFRLTHFPAAFTLMADEHSPWRLSRR
jgi:putative endonuclease